MGQRFRTVPFAVQSRFILSYTKAIPQLGVFYYTQTVGQRCTNLTYSIMSANRFEIMQLLVDRFDVLDTKMIEMQSTFSRLKVPIHTNFVDLQMNITLQDCPLGFIFIDRSMTCGCASILFQHKISIGNHTNSSPIWE